MGLCGNIYHANCNILVGFNRYFVSFRVNMNSAGIAHIRGYMGKDKK